MATGRIGVTPTLRTRWSKAPAGGTTSLSGLDDNSVSLVYDVGYEAVYRNGVLLSRTNDYTATTGNSITLIDATIAGDIIEVFANQLLPLTNAIGNGQYNAKGALLSATAASTPAVLAVGSNDQVLTADSSTATGLKWATPAAPSFVGCTLSSTAGQSISNSTVTAVTFGSEDIDTDGFHSTVTNTDRITIPSGKGGKYLIYGQVRYDTNSTGRRVVYIQLNNTTDIAVGEDTPGASTKTTVKTSIIYSLAVGDYIRLNTFQTQGVSQSLLTDAGSVLFGVVYLGA